MTAARPKKPEGGDMLRLMTIGAVTAIAMVGSASAQQPLVERGAYLVNGIGGCNNCHTPRGPGGALDLQLDKRLSGSTQTFQAPQYTVKGSNLTPDNETGLGQWSDGQIKVALTDGKGRDGRKLAPNMPSAVYGFLTLRDQDAIVAYLRSIPAVKNAVQKPEYKAPFDITPYPNIKDMSEADLADPIKRGQYLMGLGHCMVCHSKGTPPDKMDYVNGLGGGGRKFGAQQNVIAANLTTKGVASWTVAEFKRALTEGVSRDGRKLNPPMVDFAQYYKTITDDDINAMFAYMKSLKPVDM
jgi:mono/diheme cytochrome c family protein